MWLSRIFYLFIFVILVVANLNILESVQAADISINTEITVANTNTQENIGGGVGINFSF